jgi:hypothetical protein
MKIAIVKVFHIPQEPASQGTVSSRVILLASCDALDTNNIVTIAHPYGTFKITAGRFRELVNDESIKILEV